MKLNKKGGVNIYSLGVLLLICLFIFFISSFMEYYTIIKAVKDGLQASIITVTTENYDETYQSKREGASGGFVRQAEWVNVLDAGAAAQQLKKILSLTQVGNKMVKQNGGSVRYEIYNIQTSLDNSAFQSADDLKAFASCRLHIPIPIKLGLPAFEITVRANARWRQKY